MANLGHPVELYAVASRDDAGDGWLVGESLFHISVNGLYHSGVSTGGSRASGGTRHSTSTIMGL